MDSSNNLILKVTNFYAGLTMYQAVFWAQKEEYWVFSIPHLTEIPQGNGMIILTWLSMKTRHRRWVLVHTTGM